MRHGVFFRVAFEPCECAALRENWLLELHRAGPHDAFMLHCMIL